MNEPVILTYFAQNADATHLTFLKDERIGVQRYWRLARHSKAFPVVYESRDPEQAGIDDLIGDIKLYNNRLVLLHLSSHAGREEILLQQGIAYSSGIAGYLRDNALNLKVVVLNGCSTAGQVDSLFAQVHSIQAVVATHCPISDARAKDFSISFHQKLSEGNTTIRQAYKEGLNAVRIKHHTTDYLRSAPEHDGDETTWRSNLRTTPAGEHSWGLFVRDENPSPGSASSVLDDPKWWQLEAPVSANKLLREDLAYTCDRTNHLVTFSKLLYPNGALNQQTCQHYLIVGEESQSPLGLARKLTYEKITGQNQFRGQYYYSCDPIDPGKRINYIDLNRSHTASVGIMNAIYERIPDIQFPPSSTEEQLFVNFLRAFQLWKFVIIAVRIRQDQIIAEVVDAIGQFMAQLERLSTGTPSGPQFLFFWNVSYRSKRLPDEFRERPVERIVKQFASLPTASRANTNGLWLLNDQFQELDVPNEDDIDIWLDDNLLSFIELNSAQKTAICGLTDVKDLENELIKLIGKANAAVNLTP